MAKVETERESSKAYRILKMATKHTTVALSGIHETRSRLRGPGRGAGRGGRFGIRRAGPEGSKPAGTRPPLYSSSLDAVCFVAVNT